MTTAYPAPHVTAFEGIRRIASGSPSLVAAKVRDVLSKGEAAPVLVFDDLTGIQIDLDLRQLPGKAPAMPAQELMKPRSAGRPRLGVVAREVTLLPRHWDWLAQQRGGGSAALRRLIDQARRQGVSEEAMRAAREAVYRFMTAMAGNAPGYEEALRALFAGNAGRFSSLTSEWPVDVREHIWRLAPAAFGFASFPLDGVIPFAKREVVLHATSTAFGAAEIESAERITKGESGAGIFKITVNGVGYLLRIEGPRDGLRDPVRQYTCMRIAAEAGVAPRVIYANADHGVAITGYIRSKPVQTKRAREESLRAVITAVKRLHAAPLFPALVDYLEGVGMLIRRCQATGILPEKILTKYLKFYEELAAVYPRRNAELVSSHNDLNPGNVLFGSEQAWLVDWEAAFAADQYVDLAALANFFAESESDKDVILQSYFGAATSDVHRARLFLMQQVNRIFYAVVTLNFVAAARPGTKLKANDFKKAKLSDLREGGGQVFTLETKILRACALLNDVAQDCQSSKFRKAIALMKISI
jgi:thiamine kinase-like enzyme